MSKRRPVVIGQQFGRYTVVSAPATVRARRRVRVQCRCGSESRLVRVDYLLSHHATSCGCRRTELLIARSRRPATGGRFYRPVKPPRAVVSTVDRHTAPGDEDALADRRLALEQAASRATARTAPRAVELTGAVLRREPELVYEIVAFPESSGYLGTSLSVHSVHKRRGGGG